MVPDAYHDFFVASASAAGALVGLLFAPCRSSRSATTSRAAPRGTASARPAALTVFSNALVISLFALVPGDSLGETATIVAALGVGFVVGSTLRLLRLRRGGVVLRRRDVVFVVGGAVLFAWQMETAIRLWIHPRDRHLVGELAVVVVISFTYGIARAWELIGGPQVGVVTEMGRLLHSTPTDAEAAPAADEPEPGDS